MTDLATFTELVTVSADSVVKVGNDVPLDKACLLGCGVGTAFLPTPVPRSDIDKVLALAAQSASNSNCQPWQVHVLTGAAKLRLTAGLLYAHDSAGHVRTREYDYQLHPDEWPEPFSSRRHRFGQSLYGDVLGIASKDTAGRLGHHRCNYDFFGAPVGIILTVSRHPLQSALVDAGLFLQALMLAARGAGLDTCAQASFDYRTNGSDSSRIRSCTPCGGQP